MKRERAGNWNRKNVTKRMTQATMFLGVRRGWEVVPHIVSYNIAIEVARCGTAVERCGARSEVCREGV